MTEDRDVMDTSSNSGAAAQVDLPSHIETTAPDNISAVVDETIVHGDASGLSTIEIDRLTADIIAAVKTVYDPEIPVDIYELGLIYKVDIDDNRHVAVDMTLTAPGCPVAGEMPIWVEGAISMVEGVSGVTANMVFDPPWDISRMSDEARVALNMW